MWEEIRWAWRSSQSPPRPSCFLGPASEELTRLAATMKIQLLDSPRSCETMPLTRLLSDDDSEKSGLLSRTPSVDFPKSEGRV